MKWLALLEALVGSGAVFSYLFSASCSLTLSLSVTVVLISESSDRFLAVALYQGTPRVDTQMLLARAAKKVRLELIYTHVPECVCLCAWSCVCLCVYVLTCVFMLACECMF